ncbi:MAG: GNAT family N-acetyltransferase [Negativicutes bacterium]|nr:GNAT family N-acetyltransferase [Negativicutes bacterium]
MELIIRRANENDYAAVMSLYGELTGVYGNIRERSDDERRQVWLDVIADKRQHLLVAEVEGKVVGTLNLSVIPNLGHGGQPWAAIDNVAVDTAYRSRGIGQALVAEAGNIARKFNCYKIILSSNLARTRAHDFYRRLGWKETHIGFSLEL